MDSRRLSCSFMALAAASKSLNILGLTAGVCAMTPLAVGSTFSTALQHGQVISKAAVFSAIQQIIAQISALDRETQWGWIFIGKMWNRESISQPSRITETTVTVIAKISPKLRLLRRGSNRLATKPRMFRVAKPKTNTHRML